MTLSLHNAKTIAGKRDALPNVGGHVIRIEGFSENGEPFALSIFSRGRLEFQITEAQTESPDQGQLALEPIGNAAARDSLVNSVPSPVTA